MSTATLPFARVLAKWRAPLAATPELAPSVFESLRALMQGLPLARVSSIAEPAAVDSVADGVAVVRLSGIVTKNASALEMIFGAADLDEFTARLRSAADNPAATAIVLSIASPGGTVAGVAEAAAIVRTVAKSKPVVAFADELCASAAYWIASAANQIAIAPSAQVGSVGIYTTLVDSSQFYKDQGLQVHLVKAGKHKAIGAPGNPISEEDLALIKADVDSIYSMFVADVRRGRPSVPDASLEGQTFRGQSAVTAGLADVVVNDLAGAVALARGRITSKISAGAPAAGSKENAPAVPKKKTLAERVADMHARAAARAAAQPETGPRSGPISCGPTVAPKPTKAAGDGFPAPRDDREALAIYQRLAGATRSKFYAMHEQAIWRAYRARDNRDA